MFVCVCARTCVSLYVCVMFPYLQYSINFKGRFCLRMSQDMLNKSRAVDTGIKMEVNER